MADNDRSPQRNHPSQWSPEILKAVRPVLAQMRRPLHIHDPFAGTGVRLGQLCDELGATFTGTEIEPEFIADPRVKAGDSTQPLSYPQLPYVIVTSPVYPNGMADHFCARDDSERHTYRQGLAKILGEDRPLHEHNMGRYSIRSGRRAFQRYTDLAVDCMRWWWPAVVLLNVSDFVLAAELFPLVRFWRKILRDHGYKLAADIEVTTRRQRQGANGAKRAPHELILTAFPREET